MANPPRTHEVSAVWQDTRSVYWTSHYLKKLLIERHSIRAAIENPGGSIITMGAAQAADADQLPSYSSVIGNDVHLDLLEAEQEVNTMELRDRIELLAWCDGLSPKEAAQWANLKGGKVKSNKPKSARQRIDRNVTKVAAKVEQDEH